jgi:hypothetical protein
MIMHETRTKQKETYWKNAVVIIAAMICTFVFFLIFSKTNDWYSVGLRCFNEGKYDEAMIEFDQSIYSGHRKAESYMYRMLCKFKSSPEKLGHGTQESIDFLDRQIRTDSIPCQKGAMLIMAIYHKKGVPLAESRMEWYKVLNEPTHNWVQEQDLEGLSAHIEIGE